MMYQQQQPQQYYQRQPYVLGLRGRPVSSIDEVRAIPVEFDGSVSYFPDLANNRIYTKQINLDGTASLLMYELKEIPTSAPTDVEYITRQEFESVLAQLRKEAQPQAAPQRPAAEFKF